MYGAVYHLCMTPFPCNAMQIIITNCYLPLVQASIEGTWLGAFLLQGIYPDLTPGWYSSVGRTLIITQLIGIPARAAETLYRVLVRKIKVCPRTEDETSFERIGLKAAHVP